MKTIAFAAVVMATVSASLSAQLVPARLPQRAAPMLGPLAPTDGALIPNAIVSWAYWGISAYACTTATGAAECVVHLTNGSDVPHSLCLADAMLLISGTDSLAATLVVSGKAVAQHTTAKAAAESKTFCIIAAPHAIQRLTARANSLPSARPIALALSLEERLDPNNPPSFLHARARVPMLAMTPPPK